MVASSALALVDQVGLALTREGLEGVRVGDVHLDAAADLALVLAE
jgi:hypothetical protein